MYKDFIHDSNPFGLTKKKKEKFFFKNISNLEKYHTRNCEEYKNIVRKTIHSSISKIEDFNFIPTSIFKNLDLKSVNEERIHRKLNSSGTSNQNVSKIFLDKFTALSQTKSLINIVNNFIGNKRLPMIIIERKSHKNSRNIMNASSAAIKGFSIFGSDYFYLLNDNLSIDQIGLKKFLKKHKSSNFLIFGFTYMIWKYFFLNLNPINFENSILIHGGGWKKLADKKVSNKTFNDSIKKKFKLNKIHNYYGMVEQTGSIYMECEIGERFHVSNYSEIIIRDMNFKKLGKNKLGFIQSLSILPKSYPGHSLLTEDLGMIIGEDDCPCGRKGKYFKVTGRIERSEIRGCSDTIT